MIFSWGEFKPNFIKKKPKICKIKENLLHTSTHSKPLDFSVENFPFKTKYKIQKENTRNKMDERLERIERKRRRKISQNKKYPYMYFVND